MKTMRFHLPVLDADDAEALLDLLTRVRGVAAAIVDAPSACLDVVVSSRACGSLVRREVEDALLLGWASAAY